MNNASNESQISKQGDDIADALAAVALVAIFVVACIFWVSGH